MPGSRPALTRDSLLGLLVLAVAPFLPLGPAACGEGTDPAVPDAGDADAGADGGHDAEEVTIRAPAAPALPIWDCPPGWRPVVVHDDPATCEPWPDDGRQECAAGEAHYPGEPGCVTVGSACPEGEWPADLPAEGVRYVSLDGDDGAKGTDAEAPLRTIGAALLDAPSGTTVALGRGTWDEDVRLPAEVTLRGLCAADTQITGLVQTRQTGVVIRDVHVAALGVSKRGQATASGLWVEGGSGAGIFVGGELDAEDILVRATGPNPVSGNGDGIEVTGRLTLTRAEIEENIQDGILLYDGGDATLRAVSVHDTHSRTTDGSVGHGIDVGPGSTLQATECVVEDNRDAGISVLGDDARLEAFDLVVRRTAPIPVSPGRPSGRGLQVEHGAQVEVSRALFEANHSSGAAAINARSRLVLQDVVARDTLAPPSLVNLGSGVQVGWLATGVLNRVFLARNLGRNLIVTLGGSIESSADLFLRDVRPGPLAQGYGLSMQDGARMDVERVRVEGSVGIGAHFGCFDKGGVTAHVTDLFVLDTRSRPDNGALGRAVSIECGSVVILDRVHVAGSQEAGIAVMQDHSSLLATELQIRDVSDAACAVEGCGPGGLGLVAAQGGRVEVTDFRVTSISLSGLQVASGGTMDLHRGEVLGNPIGANVQGTSFDPHRLQDDVRFKNERNYDGEAIPIPTPAAGLGGAL